MAMNTWPKNLILDIYGAESGSRMIEGIVFSDEIVGAIECVLKHHFCNAELQVLYDLYRNYLSVKQAAQRHAYTETGICRIQTACIDALRRPGVHRELQNCFRFE